MMKIRMKVASSETCVIQLHSLYATSFCKEFLGAHIFLKAKLRVCTTQDDQNIWGYSTSTIDLAAFIIDALSVIIWTTCWCPTSPMTFRNKSAMKCLSLYSLVPSMDLIKSGHFFDVAIKLINGLFCTSVHPSLTMLKPFSF